MSFISNPIVAVILLLGILVFVHELGHFLVGRACGIAVEIFSIGFGPTLLKIQRGMCQYRIGILPLGGFVKFYGSTPAEPVPPEVEGKEFFAASKTKRTLTIAAGPLANIALAFVAYSYLATQGIKLPPAQIGFVLPDGAAAEVGLKSGDKVVAIDGKAIETWWDLEAIISRSPGNKLGLDILRDQQKLSINIVPKFEDGRIDGVQSKVGRIGISTGRLSAAVTPLAKNMPAARAQITPGDKVVAVAVGSDRPVNVGYWDEIVQELAKAKGATSVTLFINNNFSDKSSQSGSPYEIDLSGSEGLTGEALLKNIGLWSADLVIARNKAEAENGLKVGDRIVAVNGVTVKNQFDYSKQMKLVKQPRARITIVRNFNQIELDLPLLGKERDVPEGVVMVYYLAVEFASSLTAPPPIVKNFDFIGSVTWGVEETIKQSSFLIKILGKMMSGDVALASLGGPILIAKVAGDAAKRGLETFLNTLALISINLAVINLVPIPALDGGQLTLIAAEAIKRRRLTMTTIENFQKIGFVMIMGLMVLVFYNDLSRFWSRIIKTLVAQ